MLRHSFTYQRLKLD